MNRKKITVRKRWLPSLLVIAMLLTSTIGIAPKKAQAATQNDAVAWANAQIGKSLDYDGVYGCQCVDLIKYYYAYFGVAGYAMGNANAYISNSLPGGWTRVYSNFQPGDIAVWKVNHSCSTCNTGGYGHVGIITSADSVGFNAVNQNFNNQSYCSQNWFRCSALACAIRPAFSNPAPAPSPSVTFADFNQNGVWDTNAEMYIKVMNPNRAHVSAVGCYLYNAAGGLVKSYSESCSYTTSYVNYTCNINGDMKYTLQRGTTYKYVLYAIVGGQEYRDVMRSFTTTGDGTPPVISGVQVYDVTETGYKVKCKATDNVGIDRVQFPTWTVANGQDDIQPNWGANSAASGRLGSDGYYVYEVKTSDHKNEIGDYITHIYAYDRSGNYASYGVSTVTIKKAPAPTATPTPAPTVNENKADGNALVTVAEKEYNTYHGQSYNYQYGSSPWCCNFVSWCARQAGISTDVIKSTATVQTMYDSLMNGCGAKIVSTPQRGDLVFYKYTDYDSARFHHIGIMTSATETVQGNVNNTWWKGKPGALNNIKEMVYVRPAYNGQYVSPNDASFADYNLNKTEDTNAEVYIKVLNPNREGVTMVGCELYNEDGILLKSYSESCSWTTSYVNYNCNFNADMGYTLSPGTTYKFMLYAVVGGKRINDTMRTFKTTGSKREGAEEKSDDVAPSLTETTPRPTVAPTTIPKPTATSKTTVTPTSKTTSKPEATKESKYDVDEDDEWYEEDDADDEVEKKTAKKPSKVTGVYLTSAKKKIYVDWNWRSSNRTGYQVQCARNRTFTKQKKTRNLGYYADETVFKKLKRKKAYYVRVRAVNKVGNEIKYGKWSKVKKARVK